jgi:hypothetical protein
MTLASQGLTSVPRYRVTVPVRTCFQRRQDQPVEVAMSQTSIPIHSPAPAPQGPVACTLSPNEYAGRLDDFRHGVFNHLAEMERPAPTRLRLTLDEGADPGRVQELLVREQGCCAFMSFTLTPTTDRLVVDLEVPTEPRRPWTPWPCWPSWLPPGPAR